jgi:hypothetical protein
MKNKNLKLIVLFTSLIIFSSLVSAGIGIKVSQESILVPEGEEGCITYYVYNPFNEDAKASISVTSDLRDILQYQDKETQVIPAKTSSGEALPIEFCFKIPKQVYEKDCLIGDIMCKQECNMERIIFEGEVVLNEIQNSNEGDVQGSKTALTLGYPLKVGVKCKEHPRDLTALYIVIAAIALIFILITTKKDKKKKSSPNKSSKKKKK